MRFIHEPREQVVAGRRDSLSRHSPLRVLYYEQLSLPVMTWSEIMVLSRTLSPTNPNKVLDQDPTYTIKRLKSENEIDNSYRDNKQKSPSRLLRY